MLNRRHIRIKVMQSVYAFKGSESDALNKDQKFLMQSLDKAYNLYLLMLSLLVELQKKSEDHLSKSMKKHLATEEDKNPNRKFVNNEVLQFLLHNEALQDALETNKVKHWDLDDEYVDIIYKDILASELYADYMKTKVSDFKEDKFFVIDIYREIIAPNDKLFDYLEDHNMTWVDDFPLVNTTILKMLRKLKPTANPKVVIPDLYKDEDDEMFAVDLFKKTILNQTTFRKIVEDRTKNWDSDRIADIDYVLLIMAICEIIKFPSIPIKVTINEYLEIAKEYSTPKSSIFINGILDKYVKELQEKNELNKTGRGLM
ncbi:transcription antitermination factor NusB [Mangrovimonas cancribranchiae]|uniref:Transcription antitermination factor NusB n=1 Tax=Mangrovimonas cancribranchiae TaxID=3080055 RepID=A0AAU6P979_9FLAO